MKSNIQSRSQRGLKTKTNIVLPNQKPMKVGDFIRIIADVFSNQIESDDKVTNLVKYQAVLTWFTDQSSFDIRKVENVTTFNNKNFINKILNPNLKDDISKKNASILKSKITHKEFERVFDEANLEDNAIKTLIQKFKDYGYQLNRNNIPKGLSNILSELLEKRSSSNKAIKNTALYQKYINNYAKENNLIKNIVFRYEPVPFYKLYVCNRLSERKEGNDKKRDYIISSYPSTLIEKYGKFITITGPAGYGKSMYLKHLSLCEFCFRDNPNIQKTNYIPVLIRLNSIKEKNINLESILYGEITKYDPSIKLRTFKSGLSTGRFMFLFDALDEVDISISDIFIRELESFAQKYKDNVFVLSSRPNNLSILDKFKDLTIEKFGQNEIEKLCLKLGELTNIGKNKTFNFIGNVFLDSPHFDSVDSIPLLLTLKFYIYKETNKIANNNSGDFYHQCFHLLFSDHDQINNKYNGRIIKKYSEDELEQLIGKFAYLSIVDRKISFTYSDIANLLKKGNIDIGTNEFINYLLSNLCLFYKEKELYHFIHRSFQDYFAAHYAYSLKDKTEIRQFIESVENFSFINILNNHSISFTFYWVEGFRDVLKFLVDMDRAWFEEKIVLPCLSRIFEKKDIDNPVLNYVYHAFTDIEWCGGIIEGAEPSNSYKNDLISFIANEMLGIQYEENRIRSRHIEKYATEEFYVDGKDKDGDPIFITEAKKRKMIQDKYGDDWVDIDYCDGHFSRANIKDLVADHTDESNEVLQDIEDAFRNNYLLLNRFYKQLKSKFDK